MNLDEPISLMQGDGSGCPVALIELSRQRQNLALLDYIVQDNVRIEFPMADTIQRQTGYMRFVSLRRPVAFHGYGGVVTCHYALVEKIAANRTPLPQHPTEHDNLAMAVAQREAREAERDGFAMPVAQKALAALDAGS